MLSKAPVAMTVGLVAVTVGLVAVARTLQRRLLGAQPEEDKARPAKTVGAWRAQRAVDLRNHSTQGRIL